VGRRWRFLVFPILAVLMVVLSKLTAIGERMSGSTASILFFVALMPVLIGTIFTAVEEAEIIAHRTGEPYGTLILTLAVTIIEVALIASSMLASKGGTSLARDTVFAVIMIVCNGLVGLCILTGGLRYREQSFRVSGANAYLIVLAVLATLTLILPNFTTSVPGPFYTVGQALFVCVTTLSLYAMFLYIQTVRHQEFFLQDPFRTEVATLARQSPSHRAPSLVPHSLLLLVSLVAVILLSKSFNIVVDAALGGLGAPAPVSGIIVALLVLMPESLAAIRAALRNELQRSVNLALGSSLATIGLTIPAVTLVSLAMQAQLTLGLRHEDMVLLMLTLFVSVLTFGLGQTNILSGFVHLMIFATFVFLSFVP
jgi:Ca2+:H+ antiporter